MSSPASRDQPAAVDDRATAARHAVGRWLAAWALTVFLLVLVGGGTRLTESGLSITEWKPISGVVPPLSAADWDAEFEKYKLIPQYSQMNAGMTLAEFKGIFLWEYVHRLLARVGGLVFAIPFFWFALRRRVPAGLMPRLVLIGSLTVAQAALGWYMVASGLVERINVSQYRLAAHLSLALVIYVVTVWTADSLLRGDDPQDADPGATADAAGNAARKWLVALVTLASVTIVSGAFVAGLRAGKIYNEFPLMGAGLVPMDYGTMAPWIVNWFENPAAAQFNHRLLAIVTLVATAIGWIRLRPAASAALRLRLDLIAAAVGVQVALGITVLLLGVPVIVGVAHQAGALLVLTALVLALREARRA